MLTDEQLISGCKNNNRLHQRALVERYAPMISATVYRYCSSKAEHKDIEQESWILIFKNLKNYKTTGSLKSWIQKIAINTALKNYRKKTSIQRVESHAKKMTLNIAPEAINKLQTEDLIKLINNLEYKKRTVFNLYIIDGYNHQEIGAILNIKESSSRSILTRARQELKNIVLLQDKQIV